MFFGSSRVSHFGFFVIVGEKCATIIEKFGKYQRTMKPGLNVIIPILERISHTIDLREQVIEISSQVAVTKDNVALHIDGVLYVEVFDAYKAAYNVEDWMLAISNLA
jgi:regulator of protease activity HflC (stomatin/prohibitin superfamily)